MDNSEIPLKGSQTIFNRIFSSGVFPTQWKNDRRIPLHKKKNKTEVKNYRLIAFTLFFEKFSVQYLIK
jgi:hypothetical protein